METPTTIGGSKHTSAGSQHTWHSKSVRKLHNQFGYAFRQAETLAASSSYWQEGRHLFSTAFHWTRKLDSEIAQACAKQATPDAKRRLQLHPSEASTLFASVDSDDDEASVSSIATTLSWNRASEATVTRKRRTPRVRPGRRAARRLRSQQIKQTMKQVAADCLLEQQWESSGTVPLTVIGHMSACLESIDEERCEELCQGDDVAESLADFWGHLPDKSSSSDEVLRSKRKRTFSATDLGNCEQEAIQAEDHAVERKHRWAASLSEYYDSIEEALVAMREFLDAGTPGDLKDLPSFVQALGTHCAHVRTAAEILPPLGFASAWTLQQELDSELVCRGLPGYCDYARQPGPYEWLMELERTLCDAQSLDEEECQDMIEDCSTKHKSMLAL